MEREMESKNSKKPTHVLSVNINCDRRASEEVIVNAFPECHITQRIDEILDKVNSFLRNDKVDAIVCLFEIDKLTRDYIVKWCVMRNIFNVTAAYNLSADSFHFLVATNNAKGFVSNKVYPLTQSGHYFEKERDKSKEHLEETLFDVYEKSLFHVETFSGYHIWVTHLSLGNEAKLKQVEKIAQLITPFSKSVLVGDFNCFDRNVKEQKYLENMFQPLLKSGWTQLSKEWISTFDNINFPYDLEYLMNADDRRRFQELKEKKDATTLRVFLKEMSKRYDHTGLALDHVFTNMKNCTAQHEKLFFLTDHAFLHVEIEEK